VALYLKNAVNNEKGSGARILLLTGTDVVDIIAKKEELGLSRPVAMGIRNVPFIALKSKEIGVCVKDGISYLSKEQEEALMDLYDPPE